MHPTAAGRSAALILGSLLVLFAGSVTGCSIGGGESELESGTLVPPVSASVEASSSTTASTTASTPRSSTTTTPPSSTMTTTSAPSQPATAEAESFKALAPTIDELGDGVNRFVAAVEASRIDQLANDACSQVTADMSDGQLGLAGLAAYENLSDEEEALIELDDWVLLYGGLIGFFCPDNLPVTGGTQVQQFRAIVSDVDGVSAEAADFVTELDDGRIDELQKSACATTTEDMTTEDFGLAIVAAYDDDLSTAERAGISLSAYSELYGALVGWFCPQNLPR